MLVGAEGVDLPPLNAVVTDFVQASGAAFCSRWCNHTPGATTGLALAPCSFSAACTCPTPPTVPQEHMDPEHDPVEGMLGMVRWEGGSKHQASVCTAC